MANKGEPYFFWERKKLRQREAAEDSDNKVSEEKKKERERSKVLATKRLRERDKKRGDVPPPENFDLAKSNTSWRSHRNLLFQQWLWFCYQRVSLSI